MRTGLEMITVLILKQSVMKESVLVTLWMLEFVLCWVVAGLVVIHSEPYVDRFANWFDAKYAEVRHRDDPPLR